MKQKMLRTLAFVSVVFAVGLINIAAQQEGDSRAVAGGGITVKGWTGKIDPKEVTAGLTLNSAKLTQEGKSLHVTTGPAVTYWNPANTAKGDYTVSATFYEPKFMNLNDHPHPRRQRPRHRPAKLSLLRSLRQRHIHCPRHGSNPVSDGGPRA
jgi:hypothetical protein